MAERILLFGSRGYLGGRIQEVMKVTASEVDIADRELVKKELDRSKPQFVINAAGKTGRPNVDWCEDHKMETIHSNVVGPLVLLEECLVRDIHFTHVGSGCIYDGDNGGKGFSEGDQPNFTGSFYSLSKATSDEILSQLPVLNLRLRMPFEGIDTPRNLITKLKGYSRVLDAKNSLTYIPDFLRALEALLKKKAIGTYNVVNPGPMSPYRIMELYKEVVDPSHTFEKLTLAQLPEVAKAKRSNCVLSSEKLASEGIKMTQGEEAVRTALLGFQKH